MSERVTEEILSQLAFKLQAIFKNNPRNIVEAKAAIAAALAGLAGENARLRRIADAAQAIVTADPTSTWEADIERLRAALQEPPDAT